MRRIIIKKNYKFRVVVLVIASRHTIYFGDLCVCVIMRITRGIKIGKIHYKRNGH